MGRCCRQVCVTRLACVRNPTFAGFRRTASTERRGVGIVVGLSRRKAKGDRPWWARSGDPRKLGGDTVFEVGSVGKVFTALLLADMVRREEVALADPVARYLPPRVQVPERGGRAITLEDLATHHSGLPRLPTNFVPRDPANPYADYTLDRLYEFLSGFQLTRDVGAQYQYSNLGYGLLGHALARRAGLDYEALVLARIAAPLGLASTRIASPRSSRRSSRSATMNGSSPFPIGRTPPGRGRLALVERQRPPHVLSAHLDGGNRRCVRPCARCWGPATDGHAQPWRSRSAGTLEPEGREPVWHNGGTGGYSSFIVFSPDTRSGIVVLANAGVDIDESRCTSWISAIPWRPATTGGQAGRAAGLNIRQKGEQAPARIE